MKYSIEEIIEFVRAQGIDDGNDGETIFMVHISDLTHENIKLANNIQDENQTELPL